jgi:hypothetical protein
VKWALKGGMTGQSNELLKHKKKTAALIENHLQKGKGKKKIRYKEQEKHAR